MKILVAGAGIIGVTTAWYLARRGHEVTVLDRQPDVAMETSFANGGQVSMSGAEPWANPGAPLQILKWLGREDAPLLVRLRADRQLWSWTLRFLAECPTGRTRENTLQILRLAMYSTNALKETCQQTGIDYDARSGGILHFFTDAAAFSSAQSFAAIMTEHGLVRKVLDVAETVALEPAMLSCREKLAGAIYTPDDSSGDAHKFTLALRDRAEQIGVQFRYGINIDALLAGNGKLDGLKVQNEDGNCEVLQADQYVIALGSYSPLLLKPVGIDVPIYPVKGYSVTVDTEGYSGAPVLSLTDESRKLVFSRLGNKLRIAGTAELTGYDTSINQIRCKALVKRAQELWPTAGNYPEAEFWAGLRPATPGNVPLIGRTKIPNLYLNTGHGTLGWTLSCGSAMVLSDIISKQTPAVDFSFL
ncbi:MAG TPA: amino acid dehydrogenase [Gammaproteobacteria bacterium]|nr:amino acid dehydrogenase [Gammaproteobacteria bacterium]